MTQAGKPTLLAVCIDDFGMHDGVNQAALELGAAGRVSAVGCMVDGPAWREGAPAMQIALKGKLDIGLHLDFTEPWRGGQARRSHPALVLAAYAGRVSPAHARDEVRRQLDAFEDGAGMAPDFVDGHQHVHQLPAIREALIDELRQRYPQQRPWIRNTAPPAHGRFQLKPAIIGMLGNAALERLARAGGFRQNRHLLGVYGFDGDAAAYRQRVCGWLAQAQDHDLLMCHPAAGGSDALARARRIEYEFLRGQDYSELLDQYGVTVYRIGARAEGWNGSGSF